MLMGAASVLFVRSVSAEDVVRVTLFGPPGGVAELLTTVVIVTV